MRRPSPPSLIHSLSIEMFTVLTASWHVKAIFFFILAQFTTQNFPYSQNIQIAGVHHCNYNHALK